MAYIKKYNVFIIGLPVIIFSCFIFAFWPAFHKLSLRWGAGDNSYCYLIVPLVLYLLYDKKEVFKLGEFSWSYLGLIPILLSIFLMVFGELGSVETMLYAGIWGCAVGVTVILYGWRVRHLIFPLVILLFIVPLPPFINRIVTFQLKLAATSLSVAMLRVSGVSVLQEGNIIDLGISQLQVVDACSGLRYLMPLFLMALLVGYFFNKKLWQRVILILVVLPLSIFVNSVRIWVTGMLTVKGYEELAQSFFHDFSGWLVFMLAAGLLVAAAFILRKIGKRISHRPTPVRSSGPTGQAQTHTDFLSEQPARTKTVIASREDHDKISFDELNNQSRMDMSPWKPIVLTVVICFLFVSSGWALKVLPSARNLPQRMAFESFPMQIDGWQGKRHVIRQEILNRLWSDDYVNVTYIHPDSRNQINLLIPFYEYQGTRHTAHAPQACMLGSGWGKYNETVRMASLSPKKIPVMTTIWEKGDYKLLGSYFFFQRGRVITSPWMNKFYLMLDAVTKQRTDGALVRMEMVMHPEQSTEEAWEVLEGFIRELWPILPDYVPE